MEVPKCPQCGKRSCRNDLACPFCGRLMTPVSGRTMAITVALVVMCVSLVYAARSVKISDRAYERATKAVEAAQR
jgi:hypothetical protein